MRSFKFYHIICIITLFFTSTSQGQLVISKPNLGFTQACASPSFNTYYVNFSFSPEDGLEASNQFIIELSDSDGSFANAEVIHTTGVAEFTTNPVSIPFSMPVTVSGESYKVRIKSTSPAATSTGSVDFAAYYKNQDSPFSINNLIETGSFCAGGSYILTIDNPGGPDNDSPLQYPSLTYNWYKETSSTLKEFVASGESLNVTESGTYFVETNYGSCTSNSYSNRVTITEASSGVSSSINSSKGNPYCISEGGTTLSTINGEGYQWFKDGERIDGATNQTYETNESGVFSVSIDLGNCSTSASIDLDNTGFSSSLNVSEDNIIHEGETISVIVTTSATNPTFEWYLNNTVISGATTSAYTVSEPGSYKVKVSQTMGCIASSDLVFNVRTPFPDVANIPNLISPNADGINDTWIIPQAYVEGTNTSVTILSPKGEIVLKTTNYLNDWPQSQIEFSNVNPIYYYVIETSDGIIKRGSITIVK
ncbi:gliding motility-associated C-terminal domain-containing protein [Tamlana fucoidanivorans]|nr:gliding motility-associated C-terminal domain-containing protein [Tamlana fucoidanivorans]